MYTDSTVRLHPTANSYFSEKEKYNQLKQLELIVRRKLEQCEREESTSKFPRLRIRWFHKLSSITADRGLLKEYHRQFLARQDGEYCLSILCRLEKTNFFPACTFVSSRTLSLRLPSDNSITKVVRNVATEQACSAHCLHESAFLCLSVQYFLSQQLCVLQAEDHNTVPRRNLVYTQDGRRDVVYMYRVCRKTTAASSPEGMIMESTWPGYYGIFMYLFHRYPPGHRPATPWNYITGRHF